MVSCGDVWALRQGKPADAGSRAFLSDANEPSLCSETPCTMHSSVPRFGRKATQVRLQSDAKETNRRKVMRNQKTHASVDQAMGVLLQLGLREVVQDKPASPGICAGTALQELFYYLCREAASEQLG